MNIPIRNLYALLCYAWDVLPLQGIDEVGEENVGEPQDLLAILLLHALLPQIRQGLHRDYRGHTEDTRFPRGRLLFGPTISRGLQATQRLRCEVSELHVDVPINRAIKAAVTRLLRVRGVDERLRTQLAIARAGMRDVADVPLSASDARPDARFRSRPSYSYLLRVVRLIRASTIPVHGGRAFECLDFLRDEGKMRKLFELFVRRVFERHQAEWEVSSDIVEWKTRLVSQNGVDIAVPRMKTDVTLRRDSMTIVIEAKFTPRSFEQRFAKRTVRTAHLYQLAAYLRALDGQAARVAGVLLYPQTSLGVLDSSWTTETLGLRVKTIDLAAEWSDLVADVLRIPEDTPSVQAPWTPTT